ncbi:hypothetical protein ACHAXT_005531 [Thalassiosira profunda]
MHIPPLINTVSSFLCQWVLALLSRMGTPTKKPRPVKDGDGDDVLSPLSRSRWDSPPTNPTNRSTPPSQRKLCFERENVENDNDTPRKKKCKKGQRKGKDGQSASDAFPALCPDVSSTKDTSPSRKSSRKSILLGPKLRPRPTDAREQRRASFKLSEDTPMLLSSQSPSKKSPEKANPSSPQKDVASPLQPPSNLRSSNDLFHDFALTPRTLYDDPQQGHYKNRTLTAPMSVGSQHYHQSPHWSGQVRVNPFSPVPEQYLRPPPTSTMSATRGDAKRRRPGFYKLIDLDPSSDLQLEPRKKARIVYPAHLTRSTSRAVSAAIPRLEEFDDCGQLFEGKEISPTDIMQTSPAFETKASGKRKADDMNLKPPPQCRSPEASWPEHNNKRQRINRGRYLNDFQEVQFLGAGSFGSVNACLSRLDGCTYAIKSISPTGQIAKSKGNSDVGGLTGMDGAGYLYGGRQMKSNQCAMPPTPGRPAPNLPPLRRKSVSRLGNEGMDADGCYDVGAMEGSSHWNDGALRRVLREVFALAALCQQDDARTFHIVRYQQAWLEDDGTLYIQTELCSSTLRDEMAGDTGKGVNAFRQSKVLREVLLALELVHQQGMVHLDIKPENIFIKGDLYKLGDFGLAGAFTKDGGKDAAAPDIEEGDSRYMSKDLLDNPKDLTKCDIFSIGVTLYEVISGRTLPVCGEEWQNLRNGKVPTVPGAMPCLNAIIKEMMHPDPEKRPSASDLLSRAALRCEDNKNPRLSLYKAGTQKESSGRGLKRPRSLSL